MEFIRAEDNFKEGFVLKRNTRGDFAIHVHRGLENALRLAQGGHGLVLNQLQPPGQAEVLVLDSFGGQREVRGVHEEVLP